MSHGEQPLYKAQAVVMLYDYAQKTWMPVDGKDGVSKLYILHNPQTNMYRVVGRRQTDSEITINACLHHKLKYTQAAASFHQWRDQRQFFGFNFANQEEANKFYQIVKEALDMLVASAQTSTMSAVSKKNQTLPRSFRPPPNLADNTGESSRAANVNANRPISMVSGSVPSAPINQQLHNEVNRSTNANVALNNNPVNPTPISSSTNAMPPPVVGPAPAVIPPVPSVPPPPPAANMHSAATSRNTAPVSAPTITSANTASKAPPPPPPPPGPGPLTNATASNKGLLSDLSTIKLKSVKKQNEIPTQNNGGGGGSIMSEMQKKLAARFANQTKAEDAEKNTVAIAKSASHSSVTSEAKIATISAPILSGSNNSLNRQPGSTTDLPSDSLSVMMEKMKEEIVHDLKNYIDTVKLEIIQALNSSRRM